MSMMGNAKAFKPINNCNNNRAIVPYGVNFQPIEKKDDPSVIGMVVENSLINPSNAKQENYSRLVNFDIENIEVNENTFLNNQVSNVNPYSISSANNTNSMNIQSNFSMDVDESIIAPLFWEYAFYGQWENVYLAIDSQNLIEKDITWSPPKGPNKGLTILWFAAYHQNWKLFNNLLGIDSLMELEISPNEGPCKGITPLFWALYHNQPALANTMLDLDLNLNFDVAFGEGKFLNMTPILLAGVHKCWDLVKKMLEIKPHANVSLNPNDKKYYGSRIVDFLYMDQKKYIKEKSSVFTYLVLMGADFSNTNLQWREREQSIHNTFEQILANKHPLLSISEYVNHAQYNVTGFIYSQHPELMEFPINTLCERLEKYDFDVKIGAHIAEQALEEFVKNNGIYVKGIKSDVASLEQKESAQLIKSCLQECKKESQIEYTGEVKKAIVQEIGKAQDTLEFPVFNAAYIKEAINIAVRGKD